MGGSAVGRQQAVSSVARTSSTAGSWNALTSFFTFSLSRSVEPMVKGAPPRPLSECTPAARRCSPTPSRPRTRSAAPTSPARSARTARPSRPRVANVVSVLTDLAAEASGKGMTLGLEICNRYETNVINTAADALRLADDNGADNVLIHLDTYHMTFEEDDFFRPVLLVGDRLGYVHIGENHRGYLGSGHLDVTTFFPALAAIDYRGPITFESFSSAVVSPTLSTDLAVWRNLWNDGPALARHARGFLVNALESSRGEA
ncbi:sugar phosphate isomerase/epimerase [Rathayibacter tritici]|uniref:sugar phosphate isomerase/epimerase family protein n=1 Tax=Rathayibacter tritici TaxID=33888 RepID=UPI0030011511